jgi:signal transduction histidine kinase/putative methionine-R-sulfoxide reductase with GAF domain
MTSLTLANQNGTAPARPSLRIVGAISRALVADAPFAERVQELFALLHAAIGYRDGRLLCWAEGSQAGLVGLLYNSRDAQPEPWDTELTRRAAQAEAALRVTRDAAGARRAPPAVSVYLGLPIRWDGKLWGVLELRAIAGAEAPAPLGEEEQHLLRALTPLLAAAISGAASEETQGRASTSTYAIAATQLVLDDRRRGLIAALGRELEAALPLYDLLALLLRWALDSLGAEAGAIATVDAERGELAIQVFEGYQPASLDLEQVPRVSWEHGLAGRVARSGYPALLRDVRRLPTLLEAPQEIRAELAVPIGSAEAEGSPLAVLVLSSARPGAFDDGDLAFVQALCARAASPLRRALELQTMLEARNQLGQVFASLPVGLALMDTQGRLLRSNPAWHRHWQIEAVDEETPFQLPWDLVPLILPRLVDPMQLTEFSAVGQQHPQQVQQANLRLQNPHQELEIRSVPTLDSLGRITGRLWAVSDVTREREVERLKSEFVSVVSHELRTPLTSILGYTELLMARDFPPDERKLFVATVYNQAQQLQQLVEDLLGISRLDAGQVKLNRWHTSIAQIIKDIPSQLHAQIGERHRMVIRPPQEQAPPLYVDKDKVRQILVNLLSNAVKYSPAGGEIELAVEAPRPRSLPEDHPPGRFMLFSVRDQGLGIAKEDQQRIWERFYRVDNSNTRQIGGTGLGLSITRALVELHGGRIWVVSEPGRGSIFRFTLPVATERNSARELALDE